jgi:3D-(3,5/4)-trihydroxycyclohexane-1,2-dione acylhydrolase (decyclizing)
MDAQKIEGDAKVCLEMLSEKLREARYKSSYSHQIEQARENWQLELQRLLNVNYYSQNFKPEISGQNEEFLSEFQKLYPGALPQTSVLGEINKFLQKDYIIIGAAGSLPGDLQKLWSCNEKYSYHMEYGYSCMGYEISGALGVKLAQPDKEVYALVGDGSFLMLHSEFVTSIQERKKINVILFDNCGFGCINNLQMETGINSFMTEFRLRNEKNDRLDNSYIAIDYAKCAEGYGAKTYKVNSIQELRDALADSKKQNISTLIDIKVLPKTMTHGYGAFWNIGIAGESQNSKVKNAFISKENTLSKARKY